MLERTAWSTRQARNALRLLILLSPVPTLRMDRRGFAARTALSRDGADRALAYCEAQGWITEVKQGSSTLGAAEAAVWALTAKGREALATSPVPPSPRIGDLSDPLWRDLEYGVSGWVVSHYLTDSAVVSTQQVAEWLAVSTKQARQTLATWAKRESGWCSHLEGSSWVLLPRESVRASDAAEQATDKQAARFRAEKQHQRTGHPTALAAHIEASVLLMAPYLDDRFSPGQGEHESLLTGPGSQAIASDRARADEVDRFSPGHVLTDVPTPVTPLTHVVGAPGPVTSDLAPTPPRRVSRRQRAAWDDYRARSAEQVRRERAAREPVSR